MSTAKVLLSIFAIRRLIWAGKPILAPMALKAISGGEPVFVGHVRIGKIFLIFGIRVVWHVIVTVVTFVTTVCVIVMAHVVIHGYVRFRISGRMCAPMSCM